MCVVKCREVAGGLQRGGGHGCGVVLPACKALLCCFLGALPGKLCDLHLQSMCKMEEMLGFPRVVIKIK